MKPARRPLAARLLENEIRGLAEAVETLFIPDQASLLLFGSRTDLDARGGDIDLILVLGSSPQLAEARLRKHDLLAEMKKRLGDQRIDLKITSPDGLRADEFLRVVAPTAVAIKEWD